MQPEIGEKYLFKINDEFWIGEVVKSYAPYTVELKDASWVGHTGRLNEFVRNGRTAEMEIEYIGDWTTQWTAFGPWKHEIFKESV